ncbi:hypothetical protein GALMADRAFT_225410 [Galerina marginata CBS 339.88]|uniref:Uncharacterized protein n=1 Tax=Galerina marginata (strain CBS 339.88) TaxID=685588 RepID=A0A067TBL8_GALM3|nr:hypothetical protein GALMADRAFT_225410 [Galerina marginata CBS 339.88]
MPSQNTPERQFGRYSDLSFTVHEYHNPASDVRTTQEVLLENAYQLVKASVSVNAEWSYVKCIPGSYGVQGTAIGGNCYVFNASPPNILSEKGRAKEIKEWGSSVTEDEVFNMDDLEEFTGSGYGHILEGKTAAHVSSVNSQSSKKRENNASPENEPEPKKRKLHVGSLYNVIPQPHMHPSPFSPSEARTKGKPYKRVDPIFISPYTTLSSSDDTRWAWLIPVRGAFRWEHCTSGEFLDNSHLLPIPPTPGSPDRVSWTEASLRGFWQFLLDLRNVGSLGSLGISFHAARDKPSQASKFSASDSILTPSRATLDTSLNPSSQTSMVDYIKVYHDAPKALYVRYALDIWQYRKTSGDDKIRVLKGARLVLVDEASQGIAVS